MATRFYLPSSGTPPLSSLGVRSDWEQTTGLVRLPTFTTKQNTSSVTSNRTWASTATQQWAWYQYQSEQLMESYSWTTADTVSMVLRCAETTNSGDTHLAYIVRVVSSDGATERGVIGLYHATSTEFPLTTPATRIHSARTGGATAFTSQAGDRIIIELGVHGVTPALEAIQMAVGDLTELSDYTLTAGTTTTLAPWVELSRDVTFGTPAIQLTVDDSRHSHISDNVIITQTHNLSINDSFHSHSSDNVSVTQVHNITINDSYHTHIVDGDLVVEQITPAINLIVNSAYHSHTVDNITITQQHNLLIGDSYHSHTANNVTVIQQHNLVINDSNHTHSADSISLTQIHNLTVNDSYHTHTVDNVNLGNTINLVVSNVTHSHTVDNISITQVHNITISDSFHSHTADNVVVTVEAGVTVLIVDNVYHSHTVDTVELTQEYNITVDNSYHTHTVDNVEFSTLVALIGESSFTTELELELGTEYLIDGESGFIYRIRGKSNLKSNE